MADVRKALRALAERALRSTPRPDDGPRSERLGDALEALRLLLDHWDELFLPGALSHASALTPLTPMPRSHPRHSGPRSGTPSSAGLGRPEEVTLLALFAERGVKVHPAIDDRVLHSTHCRKCGRPFARGNDVLVYVAPGRSARDEVATHLKCRWWWWESPQSPIRPSSG